MEASAAAVAAWAAVAVTAAGTGVAVHSSVQQGKQAKANAKYNEKIANQEAKEQQTKAREESSRFLKQRQREAASNRTNIAKSGVTLAGSPLLALQENAVNAATDALIIKRDGALASNRALSEASLFNAQGKNAIRASRNEAGAALLSGVSSVASKTSTALKTKKKSNANNQNIR